MVETKKIFRALLIIAVPVALSCCTKDDIPNTPDGPFLFTSITITKNTTPVPFSPLTAGQAVSFKVGAAYTLDPTDLKNIKNVVMTVDFDAVDSSFNYVEEIGSFPDSTITLNASGTTVFVPMTATTPAAGPAYVRLTTKITNIDSVTVDSYYIVRDRQYWPLK